MHIAHKLKFAVLIGKHFDILIMCCKRLFNYTYNRSVRCLHRNYHKYHFLQDCSLLFDLRNVQYDGHFFFYIFCFLKFGICHTFRTRFDVIDHSKIINNKILITLYNFSSEKY